MWGIYWGKKSPFIVNGLWISENAMHNACHGIILSP